MSYSIVALDRATGHFGVAAATFHMAIGSLVPHARAGVGAVATQATTNPFYGPRGLDLLADGRPAEVVVPTLVEADEGRDHRQVHVIDRQGRTAGWTGRETEAVTGHRAEDGFSVAGNKLANERVLGAMAQAYRGNAGLTFADRLLAVLVAGEAAGGDKRGRQSASLLVVGTEDYPLVDFRVDNHAAPLVELRKMLDLSAGDHYRSFRAQLPTRDNPFNF
ncbi:DUF1028 domain-containing protein [Rhodospirillaceae bacterium SYSU D60014]|uniref:DUF1028 domain-containing protein n=1 Tax=Virgifigura deserti TaxID=2268457 RepID=UPI000E6724BF